MNKLIIFAAIIAILAFCNCENETLSMNPIPGLLRSEIRDESGQYSISYRSEGLSHSEQALLKRNRVGTGNVLVKQGSYSYISPEGVPISLTYVADENGFQPFCSHLPQPVPYLTTEFFI